ncbi:MAG: hypothetical protein LQ344_008124 [Seirophora lacunosa]|nr:MAG: hypothetical protein LQ344_008124 [Seirophora lacunosa]
MERQPKSLTDAVNLLRTCELLTAAVHTVIDDYRHPHLVAFRATKQSRRSRRPVLGEPRPRGGCTVVERRIPKLLVTAGTAGASAERLGSMTGIEKRKLYYPWNSLGEATIVDVGGGVGGFDMQLRLYPKLNFVIQDRGPVLQRAAQNTWPKEVSAALTDGRVRFMEHDFFNPNPVHGAEVYWLRYILHDWADDYCVRILSAIRAAMVPRSRILICDQVMNTTNGCAEFRSAPKPLLANYGYYTRYSHQRDLCMMGTLNGIERTPAQFEVLIENAGLKLEKIWECRSQVNIIEVRLRDTPIEEDGEVANGANRHHDRTKNPDELPTPAF